MTQDYERFTVAASTSRFWRLGEIIQSGQLVGISVYGDGPVHAKTTVRVANIEYDIESDEVILMVEPVRGEPVSSTNGSGSDSRAWGDRGARRSLKLGPQFG